MGEREIEESSLRVGAVLPATEAGHFISDVDGNITSCVPTNEVHRMQRDPLLPDDITQ